MAIIAKNYNDVTIANTYLTVATIPLNHSFYGTLTVVNRNSLNAEVEVWLVPTGVSPPRDRDLIEHAAIVQKGKPLTVSALAVESLMSVVVRSSDVVTVNLNGQLSS